MPRYLIRSVSLLLIVSLLADSALAGVAAHPSSPFQLSTAPDIFREQAFAGRLLHLLRFKGNNAPKVEAMQMEAQGVSRRPEPRRGTRLRRLPPIAAWSLISILVLTPVWERLSLGLSRVSAYVSLTSRRSRRQRLAPDRAPGKKKFDAAALKKQLMAAIANLQEETNRRTLQEAFYEQGSASAHAVVAVIVPMLEFPAQVRKDRTYKDLDIKDIRAAASQALLTLSQTAPPAPRARHVKPLAERLMSVHLVQMDAEPWPVGASVHHALKESPWFKEKILPVAERRKVRQWLKVYRAKVSQRLQTLTVDEIGKLRQDLDPTIKAVAQEQYRSGVLRALPETPVMALPVYLQDSDTEVRGAVADLLYERYRLTAEREAIRQYRLYRYLWEKLAGVSFNDFEEIDFIQQAHVGLLAYIANTNQASGGFQIGMHRAVRFSIANMFREQWGFGATVLVDAVQDVRAAIGNPRQAPARLYLSPDDVRKELGLSAEAADESGAKTSGKVKPVEKVIAQIQQRTLDILEDVPVVEDQARTPWDEAAFKDYVGTQDKVLGTLTEREEMIIRARLGLEEPPRLSERAPDGVYYTRIFTGEERSLEDIGASFAVTRERIRQIETKAFRKLRHPSRAKTLFGAGLTPGRWDVEAWFGKRHRTVDISNRARRIFVRPFEPPERSPRTAPLSEQEQETLWRLISSGLSPERRQVLFVALQRRTSGGPVAPPAASPRAEEVEKQVLAHLRFLLTVGVLDAYGTEGEICELWGLLYRQKTAQVLQELPWADLMTAAQHDPATLKEYIHELFPGQFTHRQVAKYIVRHPELQEAGPVAAVIPSSAMAERILVAARQIAASLGTAETERRERARIRFYRDLFYPLMRRDEETESEEGLAALKEEIGRRTDNPEYRLALQKTYDYYVLGRPFKPRGFREEIIQGQTWSLTPAQKYGIWQSLRSLQNPRETSAVFSSDARVGKTIMAVLAAFNIQKEKKDGTVEYAVRKVLYTTVNQAKYEVEQEIQRRTDLGIETIVLKGTPAQRRKLMEKAREATGNVVVIANYESVRDMPEEFVAFAPDAHIVDEVNRLRRGEETVRAPIIFGIPAPYRIGIGARLVEVREQDVAALLSWTRKNTYPTPASLQEMSADELFVALDDISIRWRRKIVYPEIGDPKQETVGVPYDTIQEDVVSEMRADYPAWKQAHASVKGTEHVFARIQKERMASIHPGFVLSEADLRAKGVDPETYLPPKIKAMDEWIDRELKDNGKVLLFVDFIEQGVSDYLVKHLNGLFGEGAAVAVSAQSGDVEDRNRVIWDFRSQPNPRILIATPALLGSSVNLFQIPGSTFHSSLVIRLSQPWWNMDDGERLIGIGQTYPVRVVTFVSQFRDRGNPEHPRLTIEEKQVADLKYKQRVYESVVDGRPPQDPDFAERVKDIEGQLLEQTPSGDEEGGEEEPDGTVLSVNFGGQFSKFLSWNRFRAVLTFTGMIPLAIWLGETQPSLQMILAVGIAWFVAAGILERAIRPRAVFVHRAFSGAYPAVLWLAVALLSLGAIPFITGFGDLLVSGRLPLALTIHNVFSPQSWIYGLFVLSAGFVLAAVLQWTPWPSPQYEVRPNTENGGMMLFERIPRMPMSQVETDPDLRGLIRRIQAAKMKIWNQPIPQGVSSAPEVTDGVYTASFLDALSLALRAIKIVNPQDPRRGPMGVINPGDTFLGLGSAVGDVEMFVVSAFEVKEAVGIEANYRHWSRSLNLQHELESQEILKPNKTRFMNANFLNVSWGDADVLYYGCFGTGRETEEKIVQKILREMKPGARFVVKGLPTEDGAIYSDFRLLLESSEFYCTTGRKTGVWVFTRRNAPAPPASAGSSDLAASGISRDREDEAYDRISHLMFQDIVRNLPGGGVVVLDAPSGAGKTGLSKKIVSRAMEQGRRFSRISLDMFHVPLSERIARANDIVISGEVVKDLDQRNLRQEAMNLFLQEVLAFLNSPGDPDEEREFVFPEASMHGQESFVPIRIRVRRDGTLLVEGVNAQNVKAIRDVDPRRKWNMRLQTDLARSREHFITRPLPPFEGRERYDVQRPDYYDQAIQPTFESYDPETMDQIDRIIDLRGTPDQWKLAGPDRGLRSREDDRVLQVLPEHLKSLQPWTIDLRASGYVPESFIGLARFPVWKNPKTGRRVLVKSRTSDLWFAPLMEWGAFRMAQYLGIGHRVSETFLIYGPHANGPFKVAIALFEDSEPLVASIMDPDLNSPLVKEHPELMNIWPNQINHDAWLEMVSDPVAFMESDIFRVFFGHVDPSPEKNLLVRKSGGKWEVRFVDWAMSMVHGRIEIAHYAANHAATIAAHGSALMHRITHLTDEELASLAGEILPEGLRADPHVKDPSWSYEFVRSSFEEGLTRHRDQMALKEIPRGLLGIGHNPLMPQDERRSWSGRLNREAWTRAPGDERRMRRNTFSGGKGQAGDFHKALQKKDAPSGLRGLMRMTGARLYVWGMAAFLYRYKPYQILNEPESALSIYDSVRPRTHSLFLRNWLLTSLKLLQNPTPDQKALLERLQAAKDVGIDYPFRFPGKILDTLIHNRKNPQPDRRPLAVVVLAKADWNHGFYHSSHVFDLILAGYRVMLYEVGSVPQMVLSLQEATAQQKAALLLIGGHSNLKGLRLGRRGPDAHLTLDDEERLALWNFKGSLGQDSIVILDSCSLGAGGALADNLANMLSRVLNHSILLANESTGWLHSIKSMDPRAPGEPQVIYWDGIRERKALPYEVIGPQVSSTASQARNMIRRTLEMTLGLGIFYSVGLRAFDAQDIGAHFSALSSAEMALAFVLLTAARSAASIPALVRRAA
jgi:hypothetical protein